MVSVPELTASDTDGKEIDNSDEVCRMEIKSDG